MKTKLMALEALKTADDFCGGLTSEECPDTVHIPIRSALAALEADIARVVEPCGGCGETDPDMRCIGCHHVFASPQEDVAPAWIAVSERLPDYHQSVALISMDRTENVAGFWRRQVQAAGYLSESSAFDYWSVCGEPSLSLEAFTHWMPLPPAPGSAAITATPAAPEPVNVELLGVLKQIVEWVDRPMDSGMPADTGITLRQLDAARAAIAKAESAPSPGFIGTSDEADFSTNKWTFVMAPGYRVSAGQYLITKIPKATA